ncbi:hypothetical protein AMATHDRAFT_74889 [Amanita thiersii Skay4041]|uniref:Csf1 N-terminal domain-containing protein n=1 Tax=Amanita thiersii Skay4041 TaxID=703135 RepID=A0A2A9NUT2_9AGAR|nr:hypothetical protein AMATHDRAFT_74889 [Amanita thiersii Skay4041]
MLDRLVLVSCICIGLALVIYFFYWNRFLALLIGSFLRILYWRNEGSSIWIEIGSIQFSILAGRILLKDVHYHSCNQTIKVLKGQIQWRYWIRRPTSEEEMGSPFGEIPKPPFRPLSCRIQVTLHGFEWFLYNRTAAYDHILSQMNVENPGRTESRSIRGRKFGKGNSRVDTSAPPWNIVSFLRIPLIVRPALDWFKGQLPSLDPMDLFPVGIEGVKGAIICGNSSTPQLLLAEFQRAEGTYGYVSARSKHDPYKQLLTLRFQRASISYVENERYIDPMLSIGQLTHGFVSEHSPPSQNLHYRSFDKFWRQSKLYSFVDKYMTSRRGIWHQRAIFSRLHRKSHKHSDESTPIGADFSHVEYAMRPKLLEAPVIELSYYCDAVGHVPDNPEHSATNIPTDIGNSGTDPEWGIDINVYNGTINYGPWADRQRIELQKTFFPMSCQNAEITPHLQPGDLRTWTAMQVLVELRGNTTWHIPFREASKDWQWDGKVDIPNRPRKREPALIQIAIGDSSSIRYTIPMVADVHGYTSTTELHLDGIMVTSSLNDIRLIHAETCRVRCEMPSPLQWNSERMWQISVTLREPLLNLIRDHINMFTDLGKDWAAGPPHDYYRFIPTVYNIDIDMHRYDLTLYLNDNNIIDKPLIKEENVIFTTSGIHIKNKVTIPSNVFRPERTTVPFSVEAPDVTFTLSLPRWNTNALHVPKDGNTLGKASYVRLDGSYLYYAQVRPDNVEQLNLNFTVRNIIYKTLGWSIRYFLVLKDNYFGSFTHFSTLCEYLTKRDKGLSPGDPIMLKYRPGKANMMQVTMSLHASSASLVLPAGLPGYESMTNQSNNAKIGACLILRAPEMQLHLRSHDHFMEMSLNADTVSGFIDPHYPENLVHVESKGKRRALLIIDGIDVAAHRLFGPQPRNATYVCIWEIQLGDVRTVLSAHDARTLVAVGDAFRTNFVDLVNAPSAEFLPRIESDVTFYRVSLASVDITWQTNRAALAIGIPKGVVVNTNDLGSQYHQKLISLRVPSIIIKALLRSKQERAPWLEAAILETNVYLDTYLAPRGFRDHTQRQIAFIREQDQLSGRAHQMFGPCLRSQTGGQKGHSFNDSMILSHMNGVFLPQPIVPDPSHRLHATKETNVSRTASYIPHDLRHDPSVSDSDGETGISEAERDARLAKTRSTTPLPHTIEEESITSGDESDDADLTAETSSDSGWSDLGDQAEDGPDETLLKWYARLCRHYILRQRGEAAIWNGPPFVLTKDRRILHFSGHPSKMEGYPTSAAINVATNDGDCDVATIHIVSRRGTRLKATPLIVPTINFLAEDVEQNPLGPELLVDSLLVKHLGGLGGKSTSRMNWRANFPLAIIQIVQHLPVTAEREPLISRNLDKLLVPSKSDITAIMEIRIEGFASSGTMKQGSLVCHNTLKCTSIGFRTSLDGLTTDLVPTQETSATFALANTRLYMGQEAVEIDLGSIKTSVAPRSPEFVAATSLAVAQSAGQVIATINNLRESTINTQKTTVHSILTSSSGLPVVEPLSTIQPSYLVQSGVPHDLRLDTKCKFLFHLRDCLWNLRSARHSFQFTYNVSYVVSDDIFRNELTLRLRALDPDTLLSSIESLFYRGEINTEYQEQQANSRSTSIRSGEISLEISDPSGKSPSRLHVSGMHGTLRVASFDVHRNNTPVAKSMSQTSLRPDKRLLLQKTSASLMIGDVSMIVLPHLITFSRHLVRLKSSLEPELDDDQSQVVATKKPFRFMTTEVILSARRLHLQAAAENIIFEIGTGHVQGTLSSLRRSHDQQDESTNTSLMFGDLYFRARSSQTAEIPGQDILAAVEVASGKLSIVGRQESRSRARLRLVFSSDTLQLKVPRSALRLYHFVEEWRDDYLPELESTMKAFLSEIKKPHKVQRSTPPRSLRQVAIQLHGKIGHFGVALQVMHGTWLSWDIYNIAGYVVSANTSSPTEMYSFGLQISSTAISVSARPSTHLKMALPSFTITGRYDGLSVHVLALIDFIEVKIKPSHWDKLLMVQQKFGQDFNDLLSLMQERKLKRASTVEEPALREHKLRYGGFLKMRGFRIGLEGMTSTVYLQCQDIGSGLDSAAGNSWHVTLSNLALSLVPRSTVTHPGSSFNRKQGSAFVVIDFMISAESGSSDTSLSIENRLRVSVTKIHAVMQPSSINEVGEFVDEIQFEVLGRKEQRSLELAAFKEKTRSVLKTFDVRLPDVHSEETTSWLDSYVIDIIVQHVGVAFPLAHDEDSELSGSKIQDTTSVRAFLFSVSKIEFGSHRGETSQITMRDFSFQFVPRFRQSVPSDFSGEIHQTKNRLIYPEMKAHLRATRVAKGRRLWLSAIVSGFILDIDSTISEYIFSLIDVYRRGRESVERISATVPLTPSTSPRTLASGFIPEERPPSTAASHIFGSFKFLSGKVRLYNVRASEVARSPTLAPLPKDAPDDQLLRLGVEIFNLPEVSVWTEYRATPTSHKLKKVQRPEPSTLMFRSTIHSSENTLRPTALQFISEVVGSVERRLRKISNRRPSLAPSTMSQLPSAISSPGFEIKEMNFGLRISFSLRIDRSRLEFTCQPDVNVIAGLHWESGGFAINVFPGAQKVTFTGTVGGLSVGLKHGFLSEDCVKLDARNLAFTLTLAKLRGHSPISINCISLVLDTEFLGTIRFSRLQDVLCFKAVWLDNIPILNSQQPLSLKSPRAVNPPNGSKQSLITAILVRIRRIMVDVDLGQSISTVTLDLSNSVLRTNLSDSLHEVSISVQEVAIRAVGNMAGRLHVRNCVFQTTRRFGESLAGQRRMVELRMTSGPLSADLHSEHQKLLRYRAEPLAIEIYDDWSNLSSNNQNPLQLAFTVASPAILAVVTVGTVPKLMAYANKFQANLNAQRDGASRESAAFNKARSLRVDNPLTTVAEAMLQSARTRLKRAENALSYMIRQHLSFRLDRLHLVVFPRTVDDNELASFVGEKVRARLDRLIISGNSPAERDLHLSFSSMGISRHTQLIQRPVSDVTPEAHAWLMALLEGGLEATIVGLPCMRMHMASEQVPTDRSIILSYDFNSEFIRREGAKDEHEDIYITLNVSLYSWLTILRKNLTREMEQVRNATDRQHGTKNASPLLKTPAQKSTADSNEISPASTRDVSASVSSPVLSPLSPSTAARHKKIVPGETSTSPETLAPVVPFPTISTRDVADSSDKELKIPTTGMDGVVYVPRSRNIERLKMQQLGEATPDVMHPFFMKKAGFNLEDSLPQYVHEYATIPLEEIMEILLRIYSRQLLTVQKRDSL